ncbi:MAG TPA: amidohydrolase family protein [Pseudolabrys sp.]|nr:amidohydrolase family protein [Pseudolabrys sp.]
MTAASFPPAGACDSHVHVIGPKSVFPLPPDRTYTPMDAPAGELRAMLTRLKLERVVLVQPSFYRTDNSCMLAAMAEIPRCRGVAVLPSKVSDAQLDDLDDKGIRGLRVNIASAGAVPLDAVREQLFAAARLCERHGWHVQMFVEAETLERIAPSLLQLPVHSVIDHFGLIPPGTTDGPLRTLTRLLQSGNVWVKISGAYRTAQDPYDPRLGPLARRLVEANPDRIVWGSDWPHTPAHGPQRRDPLQEMPFQNQDTPGLLNLVPQWLNGDDKLVRKVLVSNPARLYGFD